MKNRIHKAGYSLYWGYVDIYEKIHVKRYKGDRAIRNAEDSGTTTGIFEPFEADSLEMAAHIMLELYREARYTAKPKENGIIQ